MPVGNAVLSVDQYADFALAVNWSTYAPAEGPGTASPVDFSGASARMMVRASPSGTVVVSVSTIPNTQGSVTLDSKGNVDVAINAATTGGLAAGTYGYDLFVDWPDGTHSTLLQGKFIVNATNTHTP